MAGGRGGGGGGGKCADKRCISMGRDVLPKGVLFSECLEREVGGGGGGVFHRKKNLERDSNIYLSGKGFMSV